MPEVSQLEVFDLGDLHRTIERMPQSRLGDGLAFPGEYPFIRVGDFSVVVLELLEVVAKMRGMTLAELFQESPSLYRQYREMTSVKVGSELEED